MQVHLGTRYYAVDDTGLITPKIVLRLPYSIPTDSFSSPEQAIPLAIERVQTARRGVDSVARKRELGAYIKRLREDPEAIAAQLESGIFSFERSWIAEMLTNKVEKTPLVDESKIPNPGNYFLPGATVWVGITPSTHNVISGGWRPALYFVLRTKIENVEWMRWDGGTLSYKLDSHYSIHRDPSAICASIHTARMHLASVIQKDVPAAMSIDQRKLPIFSLRDEKKAEKAMWSALSKRADLQAREP